MSSMVAVAQMKAVADAMVALRSFARRRFWFGQAKQRSTTQRLGCASNPTWLGILLTVWMAMQVAPYTCWAA